MKIRRVIAGVIASVVLLTTAACGGTAASGDDTTIVVGTVPGPYTELFKQGIQPTLEKEGYKIRYQGFSDHQQANQATQDGQVDVTIMQHLAFMQAFNKSAHASLTDVVRIPSLRSGIFSTKRSDIKDVRQGDSVLVPTDPGNQARSLALLQAVGWIKLGPIAAGKTATPNDIVENPHKLDIRLLDRGSIPRALPDADWGVVDGAGAYNSHIDRKQERATEKLKDEYVMRAVVAEKQKNDQWVKDLVKAYQSKTFIDYMESHNPDHIWYVPGVDKA